MFRICIVFSGFSTGITESQSGSGGTGSHGPWGPDAITTIAVIGSDSDSTGNGSRMATNDPTKSKNGRDSSFGLDFSIYGGSRLLLEFDVLLKRA